MTIHYQFLQDSVSNPSMLGYAAITTDVFSVGSVGAATPVSPTVFTTGLTYHLTSPEGGTLNIRGGSTFQVTRIAPTYSFWTEVYAAAEPIRMMPGSGCDLPITLQFASNAEFVPGTVVKVFGENDFPFGAPASDWIAIDLNATYAWPTAQRVFQVQAAFDTDDDDSEGFEIHVSGEALEAMDAAAEAFKSRRARSRSDERRFSRFDRE